MLKNKTKLSKHVNYPSGRRRSCKKQKIEAKIVNTINFIKLKNKKRVTSQRIFSFINKGALQLDYQKFNDIICDMEIDGKIYKNGSGKNASFYLRNYFSLETVSPDKILDLAVNNTHSQSSDSFAPNKSIATPGTSKNLENFIDSGFDRIHSATPIIRHVKTPPLQTKGTNCTRTSVNANYLSDAIFWQEENQLKEIRKSPHQRYQNSQRKPNNQNQLECKVEDKSKWRKNTTLIVGDSMISGIDQQRLSVKRRMVKVRSFPGATINDICDYIKSLLKEAPDKVILHVGTNDAPNSTSGAILDMLSLKSFIEKTLPQSKVCISNVVKRTDNGKATLTVNKVDEHLSALQLDIVDNSNINVTGPNRGELHLNETGTGKLAVNSI